MATPLDALLYAGGVFIGAAQMRLGVDAAPRPLLPAEVDVARRVFRGALQLHSIRVVQGVGGLFSLPPGVAAFVVGNTVRVLRRHAPPSGQPLPEPLLVHELVHCWQYQHGGRAYLSLACAAQAWGEGYDFSRALRAGRRWAGLNPEQQAALIEHGHAAGAL
ncbi:MAG: hypothetical protein FJ086_14320, partial [Deltaproteobacteria bacterium]|nr:hypothetical protein [Deltaproteobacteria bacterium]